MPILKQCRRCQALIRQPKYRRQKYCADCNKSTNGPANRKYYKDDIAAKRFKKNVNSYLNALRKNTPAGEYNEWRMFERKAYLQMKLNVVEKTRVG